MCSEAKNERKDEGSKDGSGCCPENFQEMFRNMSGGCFDQGDLPDCREIMARMKAGCCGPEGGAEKKQHTQS
jgi:hypothetical protein